MEAGSPRSVIGYVAMQDSAFDTCQQCGVLHPVDGATELVRGGRCESCYTLQVIGLRLPQLSPIEEDEREATRSRWQERRQDS